MKVKLNFSRNTPVSIRKKLVGFLEEKLGFKRQGLSMTWILDEDQVFSDKQFRVKVYEIMKNEREV